MTSALSAPFASLQHTEAVARAELLTVRSYDVTRDLAGSDSTFGSVTTIDFTSRGGTTFVDLKPASLEGIRLDGRPLETGLLSRGRFPLETTDGDHQLVVEATWRTSGSATSSPRSGGTTSGSTSPSPSTWATG